MPQEEIRIGVYVCHCGVNIAAVVDSEAVAKYAATLPNVVVAKDHVYMCSAPGQSMIKEDIKEHKLNRVIVASCSPIMHEPTFRRCVSEAGLNPYLFEMANIREQCSWVHPKEPEKATQKAKDLVRMAVAKARLLERLHGKEAGVTLRALVIGAGIAGMRSALDLADRGFEVYLIEKAPSIGGRMAQLNELYPTGEYALDVLKPVMDAVMSHPKIKVFTNSKLEALDGFIGNFKATIIVKPRYVRNECDLCGNCETVCPVEVPNEFDFGLSKRKAIYLSFAAALPRMYVIDYENCNKCGKCIEACKRGAIDLKEQPMKMEVDVGTIIVATGHDIYEPPKGEYGYKVYDNVITLHQLERLLDENGPTKGQLQIKGSTPKSVVFISCVGSRQEPEIYQPIEKDQQLNRYCSRVCCTATFQNALTIKKKYPATRIYYLFRDIRTFGKGHEELYRKASETGVMFVKYKPETPPLVSKEGESLVVTVQDILTENETLAIPVDLVVLNVGVVPRADASEIQDKLRIPRGADGFFQEVHAKLRPLDTAIDGVYLAGTAQGPKDITDSAAQGSAAAAKACIPLARGKVYVELTIATVNEDLCSGCRICEAVCEYGAIEMQEKGGKLTSKVLEALCKGCGTCGASCPTGAITMRHFTDNQLIAQVRAASQVPKEVTKHD
ncbi:MAG: 4Fe-4S binding protein [Candidatus Bathyarchaeaceae archaeon]